MHSMQHDVNCYATAHIAADVCILQTCMSWESVSKVWCAATAEQLLMALKSNVARHVPTIVFCNKSSTACYVSYFLNDNNIRHVCLHANMPEKVWIFRQLSLMFLLFFPSTTLLWIHSQHADCFQFWSMKLLAAGYCVRCQINTLPS